MSEFTADKKVHTLASQMTARLSSDADANLNKENSFTILFIN